MIKQEQRRKWKWTTHSFLYNQHLKITHTVDPPSVPFSSVAQSCPTLCNPMDSSTPGLPVHHQFPEFTQSHYLRKKSSIIQKSFPGDTSGKEPACQLGDVRRGFDLFLIHKCTLKDCTLAETVNFGISFLSFFFQYFLFTVLYYFQKYSKVIQLYIYTCIYSFSDYFPL